MSSAGDFAKKVYDTLSEALQDISTLTVVTSTIDQSGQATERARTTISADGDTDFRIPLTADGSIDNTVLNQHQLAVKQARADRQATWDQVMKVVNGAIGLERAEIDTQ